MKNKTILEQELSDFEQLDQDEQQNGPVECLGKTFANDQERWEYYSAILAEKLKDPEFRKNEGFPIGEDEDILNLSDPPYYTACPNPFIEDFIAYYGRPYDPNEQYKREPYAADVSEGKSDPIYNGHSYHTKVPHKAIMRYILHYTNPSDVVFDGFCGTGMTGVAAQMCGDRTAVESLGYKVLPDGTILHEVKDETQGKSKWMPFSKLGTRKVVLNDLSPIATFISSNYNSSISQSDFRKEAENVLKDVLEECRWMYLTRHSNGDEAEIICTVWSDVFVCPECAGEVIFWKAAVDHKKGEIKDEFNCPSCGYEITKRNMERSFHSTYDHALQSSISQAKQVPVLIVYKYQGQRFQKEADAYDLNVLQKIQELVITYDFPVERMPEGKESRRNDPAGITHVHQFYTKRNLYALAAFKERAKRSKLYRALHYQFDSLVIRQSKLTRFLASYFFHGGGGWVGTPLSGTLYIPSFSVEVQPFETWTNRINKTLSRVSTNENSSICTTSDASFTNLPDASVDYLFIDPPFGANISYSELSYLWESWLGVKTNIKKEAIENSTQKKGINEYRELMTGCFTEAYRVLKPGRWMTVEFSNTKSAVWNSIQTSLSEAGFIISNVSALDKKQGSFKAVTTTTAVKQDLVISAYKPNGGFEDRFVNEPDEDGVWDFIHTHLGYLPIVKKEASGLIKIPERDPRILFDQVVAYFVRNFRDVPLSSKEFQEGLLERFAERDGMIFLPEQVAQYDKARVTSSQLRQLTLFVDDEASAIEWLRQLLNDKPQTYQDIHPKFIHELSGWKKAELQLELSTLLAENFLKFDGQGQVPPQISNYLSKNWKEFRGINTKDDPALVSKAKDRWYVPNPEREEDLQKLRERSLLKQFEEYKNHTGKKIKLVRMEAVRAGFKKAWQERDYATIIQIAEKIPENLLQEDQKLLNWYSMAQTRHSDSGLF